jgi:DNA phosphorothioation-dependent restriction protein DptG
MLSLVVFASSVHVLLDLCMFIILYFFVESERESKRRSKVKEGEKALILVYNAKNKFIEIITFQYIDSYAKILADELSETRK